MPQSHTISPAELATKLRDGGSLHLLDVRTPIEFQTLHAQPARNVPLDTLNSNEILEGHRPADEEYLYLICQSGTRARQAAEKFTNAGLKKVCLVEGGTQAWVAEGLPVVRGRRSVSLERQVRIAAGSLVLAGAGLALLAHPYWIALSAFVGGGLVFAGVTDTCGMGLLLAKMPWNRAR